MNCKCQPQRAARPGSVSCPLLGARVGRMHRVSRCSLRFAPVARPWADLSLHERNNLKWRNTSMSPLPPPLLNEWLYNWFFFFFFPALVPAVGAVITIYLGSLFHYSRAAAKPEEKCCSYDLWRLFDPRLLEGSTERDDVFGNRLWALLCDGAVDTAFRDDGTGVPADWKTNMTHSERRYRSGSLLGLLRLISLRLRGQ